MIIITTKKGSKYDSAIPHVSADYTLSISQNAKYLDVMTGDEVRAAMLAYTGSETSEGYLALGDANTDWQRAIYQLGMSHEANVSLSGNFKFGEAGYMPYRVSGGYLNEKGTLKTGSMERGTISLNLNPTFFDDHLTISLNGKGMFQNNRFANTGAISAAIEYDPTQPVYSEDHGLDGYWMWGNVMPDGTFEPNTQATINPLAALMQRNDVSKASRFIGNAQFDYKIHGFEDLRLNLNLGMDYSHSNGTVTVPYGAEQSYHNQTQAGRGLYNPYDQTKRDMTLEAYADYTKEINKHSFGVMAGYSWQHFYTESNSQSLTQPDPVAGSQATLSEFHNKSEYFLVSFFGRANYNYDNRYMVTATVRWDGTSRFTNNKWGFFPSVALGLNIKGESFLKNSKAVSDLKLRLSWGQTGQQDIGDVYQSIPTYQNNLIGSYYMFNGQVIVPITPNGYNADLKWETTVTHNIGLDFSFFNNTLYGTIDFFQRDTKDMLGPTADLADFFGAAAPQTNNARMRNRGWELTLGYRGKIGEDIQYTVGGSLSDATAEVTEYFNVGRTDPAGRWYKGRKVGEIWGYRASGIIQTQEEADEYNKLDLSYISGQPWKPGDVKYVDLNGDNKIDRGGNRLDGDNGQWDMGDQTIIGNTTPRYQYTFNGSISWKGLSLSMMFQGVGKRDWNPGSGSVYFWGSSSFAQVTVFKQHLDYWTPENTDAYYPNPYTAAAGAIGQFRNKTSQTCDRYLQNAAYCRLKNLTISYDLPKAWVNKVGLNKVQVFFSGENLLTFTKLADMFDPEGIFTSNSYTSESGKNYPMNKVYSIGVVVNL